MKVKPPSARTFVRKMEAGSAGRRRDPPRSGSPHSDAQPFVPNGVLLFVLEGVQILLTFGSITVNVDALVGVLVDHVVMNGSHCVVLLSFVLSLCCLNYNTLLVICQVFFKKFFYFFYFNALAL